MTYKELCVKCSKEYCPDCSCKKLCDKFNKKFGKCPADYYWIAQGNVDLTPDENKLVVDLMIDIVEDKLGV